MSRGNSQDPRLLALSNLVLVEAEVRRAETLTDLCFVMANDTHRVVPVSLAVVLRCHGGACKALAASNVSEIDPNAPAMLWAGELGDALAARVGEKPLPFGRDEFAGNLSSTWEGLAPPHGAALPLRTRTGELLGMLLLFFGERPGEPQLLLLERLGDAYAHAWAAIQPPQVDVIKAHLKRNRRRYVIAAVVLLMLPVRQYVLAPAEVVPLDPVVVAAPMAGVIGNIAVQPNQEVRAGDLLYTLEDTDLQNAANVASKSVAVAEAEYLRNAQDAYACEECRARLPELQYALDRERANLGWATEQLARSRVSSPMDGTVIYSDPNEWRGKPVTAGEKVMLVAARDKVRLKITLPIADAIVYGEGADVVFFLNVNPLDSFDATVSYFSYEAYVQADQSLAYVLHAGFNDEAPALGLRGTAKVYGNRAPILFHILRRPLAWLRRTLGI